MSNPIIRIITADIPLAAEVVAKGAQALDPRGELYTEANVGERLAVPVSTPPNNQAADFLGIFLPAEGINRWFYASCISPAINFL